MSAVCEISIALGLYATQELPENNPFRPEDKKDEKGAIVPPSTSRRYGLYSILVAAIILCTVALFAANFALAFTLILDVREGLHEIVALFFLIALS